MIRVLSLSFALLLCAATAMAACPGGSTCVAGMATVATNAALKAATAGFTAYIQRTGYYAAGDGGDAIYQWASASTCTDDGGSCIIPNSAPGTGRWILSGNGAVSVKVFGAVCDGNIIGGSTNTDDSVAFTKALAARSSVFVPANTGCGITLNSASDGIKLNNHNRLYGENQYTSSIEFTVNFTPSYNWVTGVGLGGVVVASNVGTVVTGWSHGLHAGQSITISGSATTALNGTYTIVAITAPDKFTITTSGVSNGTYTDPTSLVTPSGIGVALIRSSTRDLTPPAADNQVELDHLYLTTNDIPPKPLTFVDTINTANSRFHDLQLNGYPGTGGNGQVAFVCADVTPAGGDGTCFFNHYYDISEVGGIQTTLHWSAKSGNTGVQDFTGFAGVTRVMVDTTGNNNQPQNGTMFDWYFTGDSDPNSWDFYPGPAQNTTVANVNCESCVNAGAFSYSLFAAIPNTAGYVFTDLASLRLQGGLAPRVAYEESTTYAVQPIDYTVLCNNSTLNLPTFPAAFPTTWGGGLGGQMLNIRGYTGLCTINGNGNTIDGNSSYTINAPFTVTMQFVAGGFGWKIIARPAGELVVTTVGSLPTCGSSQKGMMFMVTDASSPTYNAHLTGGGTGEFANVPVVCNGTAWTAH